MTNAFLINAEIKPYFWNIESFKEFFEIANGKKIHVRNIDPSEKQILGKVNIEIISSGSFMTVNVAIQSHQITSAYPISPILLCMAIFLDTKIVQHLKMLTSKGNAKHEF